VSIRKLVAVGVVTLLGSACGASDDVRREVAARNAAAAGRGQVAAGALGDGLGGALSGDAPGSSTGTTAGDLSPGGSGAAAAGSSLSTSASGPAAAGRSGPGAASGGGGAAAGAGAGPGADPSGGTAGSGGAGTGAGGGAATPAPAPAGGNGGATDVGVTADTIKIGGIFFNGSWLDRYVQVAEQGARAYFRYINDQGGIYGRKINYISCDTAATADGTQSCGRKLGDADKVFAFGPSMDVYSNVLNEYITQRQIPAVGSMAYYLEDQRNPYIFPTQLSSQELAALIGTFSAQKLGVKTVGVLWIKDFIGADCLEQVRRTGQKLGYQVVVEANSGTTEDDMTPQVIKMRTASPPPDAVLFCTDAVNQTKFMQAAARQNWAPPKGWVAAYAAIDDVPKAIGPTAKGMWTLTTYDYYGSDTPGVQLYRRITNFYYPSMFHHFFSQATYAGAVALVEAIKQAGPNLTRAKLLEALRSMRNFDSGMGLTFDFGDKASGKAASGLMLQADENLRYRVATERFKPVL
jgi:ABC-type branched-subunit amino acid transport system substrate-binding protein